MDSPDSFPLPAPPFDGKSRIVEAGNAFSWIKQGWALFVVNPGVWLAITVVWLVIFLALHIVPFVGGLAANLLAPLFAAGMLRVCQKAANGENMEIPDLFAGFNQHSGALVMLGVLYMAGMLAIMAICFLIGGGGMVGAMGSGYSTGISLAFGGVLLAMLLSLALSVPLFMAIWFAPALVFFNAMAPAAALKASFNACLKNILPFLVYGLMLMVLMFFAALPVFLGFLVLVPVLAGSLYASYRDIFLAD